MHFTSGGWTLFLFRLLFVSTRTIDINNSDPILLPLSENNTLLIPSRSILFRVVYNLSSSTVYNSLCASIFVRRFRVWNKSVFLPDEKGKLLFPPSLDFFNCSLVYPVWDGIGIPDLFWTNRGSNWGLQTVTNLKITITRLISTHQSDNFTLNETAPWYFFSRRNKENVHFSRSFSALSFKSLYLGK